MNALLPSVAWVPSATAIAPALWESCFPPPLEGRWWYETLEQSGLEDQFTFLYGVVALDGQAVAIAPVFLMDLPIGLVVPPALLPLFNGLGRLLPSVRYQRTVFVGSPCADEGTVGLVPGTDRLAVLRAVQEAVWQQVRHFRASMLVWKDFPAAYDTDFAHLAQAAGLFRVVSFPGTVAPLAGGSKAGYLAALKSSRRYNLKKKWRRSAEQVTLDIQVQQHPDAATLDAVFGLFMQTYAKAKVRFERLGRPFFDHIATRPESHFILLRERASGELVAFMLCFGFDNFVINKFIGIDYRRPREWLLYFRLWEAVLDWAVARGATAIQSGQTGYAVKIEIGHQLVSLNNYCRHRNPLLHRIYALVGRSVGWHTLDGDLERHLKAHPE
ncbi:MAG: GNAT family N-acetyltransferase [Magnetococcales bacterium]|nr:GNAT family N-acetyltransferase [Magnetococcales bacterium]